MLERLIPLIQCCKEQVSKAKQKTEHSSGVNMTTAPGHSVYHKKSASVAQGKLKEMAHVQHMFEQEKCAHPKPHPTKSTNCTALYPHPGESLDSKWTEPTFDSSHTATLRGAPTITTVREGTNATRLATETAAAGTRKTHARHRSDCPNPAAALAKRVAVDMGSNKKGDLVGCSLRPQSKPGCGKSAVNNMEAQYRAQAQLLSKPQPRVTSAVNATAKPSYRKESIMTTPSSPSKRTNGHHLSENKTRAQDRTAVIPHSEKGKAGTTTRERSELVDVVDEEKKAMVPHKGTQKVAGWHKRCSSDGHVIAAKMSPTPIESQQPQQSALANRAYYYGSSKPLRQAATNVDMKRSISTAGHVSGLIKGSEASLSSKKLGNVTSYCEPVYGHAAKQLYTQEENRHPAASFLKAGGYPKTSQGSPVSGSQAKKLSLYKNKENNSSSSAALTAGDKLSSKYHMYEYLSKQNRHTEEAEVLKVAKDYFYQPKSSLVTEAWTKRTAVPCSMPQSKGCSTVQSPDRPSGYQTVLAKTKKAGTCTETKARSPVPMRVPTTEPHVGASVLCPENLERLENMKDVEKLVAHIKSCICLCYNLAGSRLREERRGPAHDNGVLQDRQAAGKGRVREGEPGDAQALGQDGGHQVYQQGVPHRREFQAQGHARVFDPQAPAPPERDPSLRDL